MARMYNVDMTFLDKLHYCEVEPGYTVPCVCGIGRNHTEKEFYNTDEE